MNVIDIDNLDIEIPNVTENVLKTKKSRSILFNWVVLFVIIFIIYLLYQRFKNSDPEPDLENLPPSIRNNRYHKKVLKEKKIKQKNYAPEANNNDQVIIEHASF